MHKISTASAAATAIPMPPHRAMRLGLQRRLYRRRIEANSLASCSCGRPFQMPAQNVPQLMAQQDYLLLLR